MPGTQATTLRDLTGTTVYNAVRVSLGLLGKSLDGRPPETWPDLLGVEYEAGAWAPARTSLLSGTKIVAGPAIETPYDRLPKPNDLFGYDWRLDCRHNAGLLLDHLKAERPKGGRWNLVGHSQGGLLIVIASTLARNPEEFSRLVARVVLIGCPLAGTLRAVEAMLVGRTDLGADPGRVEAARRMARSWPALYQMLPLWDAVVGRDGAPLGPERQFTHPSGYPGDWNRGIDAGHLKRARETAALIRSPLSHFGPDVRTLIIQGEKHETPATVTRIGSKLDEKDAGERRALAFGSSKGDGLVPSAITLDWAGERVRKRCLRLAGKVKEHAHICDGAFVTKKVARFLATAVLFQFLIVPSRGDAQQQYRAQLAASGTFSDAHALVGVDVGHALGGGDCVPGGSVCRVSEWRWLMGAYVGLVTQSLPVGAYLHTGVERAIHSGLGLGVLGFVLASPTQSGLAVRLDAQDVGAVRAGYGWGHSGGWLFAIEVATGFLRDLNR